MESIRTQTRTPDYVVMCDDSSKDDTVKIIETYIEKYDLQDKWILIENEKNLGYIKNFYKAIDMCDAELVFWSD